MTSVCLLPAEGRPGLMVTDLMRIRGRFRSVMWVRSGGFVRCPPLPASSKFQVWAHRQVCLLRCKFLHQAVALVVSAMAFQPGRYAVEAGGAEPDAESNLLQLRIARVWEFREKNLLLADEDFAYACATFAGGNYLG